MSIEIDSPAEVGADRLVNAIAAYEEVGDVCVGVDFGTGINFDAVSADGAYLGGAIAPGVEISLTALTERAARISRIDLFEPKSAIGTSSRAAIQSGVLYGFAGLVDGIGRRINDELGGRRPVHRDRWPRLDDRAFHRDDHRDRRSADPQGPANNPRAKPCLRPDRQAAAAP